MQAAKIREQGPSDHDVVKVRDDEIGVAQMNVSSQRRQKQSGHPADRKQADEPKPIKHWRVVRNRTLIERRRPVKDFNGWRNRDRETQKRKDHPGIYRLAGNEKVMTPNQEPKHGDCQAGECYELIAKNILAWEVSDQFANHPHSRQDHDVNGWMWIEPEQMLK